MARLFVAIRPPLSMRRALIEKMGGIANARWQTDAQLHLTLRFVGEVDRHQAQDIAVVLGSIHHPAFTLSLQEIGQFDRNQKITALWIGAGPQEKLKVLRNKVERALARVGVAPENRSFLPHITLARFGRAGAAIGAFAENTPSIAISAEIAEFCLYESTLGHEGSNYTIVARYPLT